MVTGDHPLTAEAIARKVGNSAIAWLNDAVHQARVTEALMRRSWE